MSALKIQPAPVFEAKAKEARPSHLYVVPDLEEQKVAPARGVRTRKVERSQTSAKSASLRTPKAKAGLAENLRSVITFVVAIVLMGAIGAGLGIIAQDTPDPEATTIASVLSGDSLWSIAASLGIEDRSLEDVVFDIKALNGLESAVLTPGQILTVPTK